MSWSADLELYQAYLTRYGDLQARKALSPTQRPLSMSRYLDLRSRAITPEELEALLFPSPDRSRRVYLATPAFSAAWAGYREELHQALEALDLEVVDPWDWADEPPRTPEEALKLARLNFDNLESCGCVLAVLDGTQADDGVCIELGWAAALGRLCNGLRTDIRQAGEVAELGVNLQVAGAIAAAGGKLARSLEELPDLPWGQPTARVPTVTTPEQR